jgi:PKD repeat protein
MNMKRRLQLIAFLIIGLNFSGFAQDYVQMMRDPNVNFYDVQQAFNSYWEGKIIEKGKGYKAFRRWESYMAPRVYPSGNMTLPSQNYENFVQWENQQAAAGIPKSVSGNWSFLGPIGKPTGGGAGRLNFVRFDPTNSTTLYVGAPDGGLWKSTNGGTSWTTNTDQLAVIGVSDIAIDPSNTQIMYIATGDGFAGDSFSTGVLKSTDGGTTWVATGLAWTANQGRTISRLLIHPTNPQILMAFASNGIWRTTNGGTTWTQPTGTFNGIMDAEFKPGDPTTVYAAGTIFKKSTDGGLNWTTITTGLTGIGRLAIAVTPANPAYVYVLGSRSSDAGFLGLIRSTNSGTTFTTRMASTASNNILGWDNGSDAGGQGWYDLAIAASPTNADEIMTGGINIWKSTNGGTSFTLNSHWTGNYSKPYVHADIHDIVYLPGSGTTVFSGNDGGIFKTTNSGAAWSDISSNLSIAQQYRIGLSASNANLLVAGHQDNGTNKLNGTAWSQIYGGDGMDCFVDRTNNNVIYGSYVYGDHYKSTNGGASFTPITTGIPAGTGNEEWLCAIHQDPVTAATIYAGGRTALYRSTNSGTSWTALGTPTGSGNIMEFVIAPSNNQIIYTIKNGTNAVSKSTNGGTSFTAVSTGLPTTVAPTGITVSNTDPNIVFVTYSGYSSANKVFKSTNGGTSWTNISTGLPNIPVNTIVFQNGAANDAVYVGTDVGVYYKNNTTAWIAFNTGLPNVSVRDLEIYYPTSRLRCATFGRGTWDSDLYSAVAAVPVASFTASTTTICVGQTVNYTNTSSGVPTSYAWTFAGGSPTTSTATNPTVTYNTAGTYTVTLTATNASGSNTATQTNYITVVAGSGAALPLTEGFTATTFPPTNWNIVNLDLGDTTWMRNPTVGLAPTAGNSMWFDNFEYNDIGNTDEMRTPKLNFQGLSSANLTFNVAYAAYDATYVDGLQVLISTDCGTTFTSLYSKTGSTVAAGNLPTAAATTVLFVPTAAQWRTETISLTPYVGLTNVTLAFRNLAGYGNSLYIDNINISGVANPVAPTASFTSAPASPVCTGQTVTYTSTSTGSPTSYSWSFPGGTPATSTLANPTVSYAAAGTYNVSLTATNGSGSNTSNQASYISVGAAPATPGSITGTASVCANTTGMTFSIAAVSGATSYTWTVPTGATITAGQGTTSITVNMGASAGNVTVTATNTCGTSSAASFAVGLNSVPATPGVISGTASVCSGSSGNNYTIAAVSGATSYTWAVPSGATITAGQGTTSVNVNAGSTPGNITVTATNLCGSSSAATFALGIATAPASPGTISGSSVACSSSTGNNYSIAAVSGATSYTWSVPTGSTITAGQGTTSATVSFGSTSGNVSVTATNTCGTSTAATFAVSLTSSAPATPGAISGTIAICAASTLNAYSIAAVSGSTTYTWTVPAGSSIVSGQGTTSITLTAGNTSGTISVVASSSCGTSAASTFTLTVNPVPIVSQSALSNACANWSSFTLNGGSPAGGTYTGTGVASGVFDPAVSGVGTFPITYSVSQSGCTNTAIASITVDACAGIDESNDQLVVIYPNPTHGDLTILGIDLDKFITIELLDVSGRLVEKWTINSSEMNLNLSKHAQGAYTLRMNGKGLEIVKRIHKN